MPLCHSATSCSCLLQFADCFSRSDFFLQVTRPSSIMIFHSISAPLLSEMRITLTINHLPKLSLATTVCHLLFYYTSSNTIQSNLKNYSNNLEQFTFFLKLVQGITCIIRRGGGEGGEEEQEQEGRVGLVNLEFLCQMQLFTLPLNHVHCQTAYVKLFFSLSIWFTISEDHILIVWPVLEHFDFILERISIMHSMSGGTVEEGGHSGIYTLGGGSGLIRAWPNVSHAHA